MAPRSRAAVTTSVGVLRGRRVGRVVERARPARGHELGGRGDGGAHRVVEGGAVGEGDRGGGGEPVAGAARVAAAGGLGGRHRGADGPAQHGAAAARGDGDGVDAPVLAQRLAQRGGFVREPP